MQTNPAAEQSNRQTDGQTDKRRALAEVVEI